jgi:hypothetical protein
MLGAIACSGKPVHAKLSRLVTNRRQPCGNQSPACKCVKRSMDRQRKEGLQEVVWVPASLGREQTAGTRRPRRSAEKESGGAGRGEDHSADALPARAPGPTFLPPGFLVLRAPPRPPRLRGWFVLAEAPKPCGPRRTHTTSEAPENLGRSRCPRDRAGIRHGRAKIPRPRDSASPPRPPRERHRLELARLRRPTHQRERYRQPIERRLNDP